MSHTDPRDPIDELRRANPTGVDRLPTSSRDRIWSRIEEARMEDTGQTRIARWVIAGSGVALVAVAAAALTLGGSAPPEPPAGNDDGGGAIGMCIQFSIEELQAREFSFDGTVASISGDQVTFTVNEALWGDLGGSVTLTAGPGMTGDEIVLEGGPVFAVGARYLVSGDDVFVWGCGFTVEYDAATAAEWAAAAP